MDHPSVKKSTPPALQQINLLRRVPSISDLSKEDRKQQYKPPTQSATRENEIAYSNPGEKVYNSKAALQQSSNWTVIDEKKREEKQRSLRVAFVQSSARKRSQQTRIASRARISLSEAYTYFSKSGSSHFPIINVMCACLSVNLPIVPNLHLYFLLR